MRKETVCLKTVIERGAKLPGIDTEAFEKLEVLSAEDLQRWLETHHAQDKSIWLVSYKASQPDFYVSREEVLDLLIAFGWIDGVRQKLDEKRTMQLISKRKTQAWAHSYKERAERLIKEGLMQRPGFQSIELSKKAGLWDYWSDVDNLIVPDDLQSALDADVIAVAYFTACPPSYQRNVLRWLKGAKTQATRNKRITSIYDHCKGEKRIANL